MIGTTRTTIKTPLAATSTAPGRGRRYGGLIGGGGAVRAGQATRHQIKVGQT